MLIKKFKTKWHRYIFQFDYAPFIVATVKEIQTNLPEQWKDLSFNKDEEGVNTGWVFSSYHVFKLLCEEFDPMVDDKVNEEMEAVRTQTEEQDVRDEAIASIKKQKLNDKLEVETLLPLFPFQNEAVDFVDKVGGRALIADPCGVGKTIEALGYAVFKEYKRVLIICPASVKQNWYNEIKKFAGIEANNITETENRGGWEIIGYPNLTKYWDYIRKEEYDLVISDESHFLKSKTAIRTKKTFKILKNAKNVIFLTGTPILNKPFDIYNIFNFISPMPFWGNGGFAERYCGLTRNPFGRWDYTGATNLGELKEKMSFMLRREKKEVLPQLPDKTINVIETEMKSWKDYREILADFKEWLKTNKLSDAALYAEALTKINYLKKVVVENKDLEGQIDNFLETGRKLVVFSQYRGVLENLYEKVSYKKNDKLKKNPIYKYRDMSVVFTGSTPTKERQLIIDKFQKDDNCKIFFSTIQAGGVGITLTSADIVIFTDLSWSVVDHQQAEDRCHRITQKNNVNVYYLITPKTIEEKIWLLLKRKEVLINKILSGSEKARKVHIKTLIKNL